MNDYNDDSDEYSSANSFRARSNTWPLNRPELTVPNASICIDEPLPEIELEEEDLFTTNDNWTTGLEDHDIMSWDPILNAQSQLQQQQQQHQAAVAAAANANTAANVVGNQQPQQQATIIHHHHQPTNHLHQAHNSQSTHVQQPEQASYHQRQQSVHLQHLPPPPPLPPQPQQQQQQPQPQQATPKHHQQLHSHLHSPHEPILGCNVSTSSVVTGPTAANGPLHQQHQPHQHQHQHHHHHPHHHQTLNNPHCLDPDDTNDYHIQQLHHLRLDSNPQAPGEPQSSHYVSQISSVCIQASSSIGNESYTTSDHQQNHHHHHNNNHHHQHHLQPLTSARYDLVQTNEYNLKTHDVDLQNPSNHLNRHNNHHLQHHHMNHHQSQQHQLQNLTSTVLDGHSGSSHPLLSSSLSISGIGLNGDLEDLDYKSVDPSAILQSLPYDDLQPLQQQQQQSQDPLQSSLQVSPIGDESVGNNETKQSNSNSTSKTKLNTPRRNAWGNMSYADLISQAINSTSDKRLTLSQIYDWMVQHVPYFKDKGDSNSSAGWKNSVRHNLSLHSRFKRLQNEGTGKSSWWTINPEANVGKCARRRAASMEASKYEKKRGRAKKRAEAVRQGLVSYPSLTNSSLNGSTTTLDQQQSQAQSIDQFHNQPTEQIHTAPSQQQQQEAQRQQRNVQPVDQFASQPQQSQKQIQQQAQTQQQQTLDHYGVPDGPSHQQQQHLQHLQQMDGQNNLHDQGLYGVASQEPQYEEKNDKISQQQQHQQSQYYYQFELSTAL